MLSHTQKIDHKIIVESLVTNAEEPHLQLKCRSFRGFQEVNDIRVASRRGPVRGGEAEMVLDARVRPGFQKHLDDLNVAVLGGPHESRAPSVERLVHVGSGVDQNPGDFCSPLYGRPGVNIVNFFLRHWTEREDECFQGDQIGNIWPIGLLLEAHYDFFERTK